MTQTVLGIFNDRLNAEDALSELEDAGFNPKDISIIAKDQAVARDVAGDTGANVAGGAVSGATTGAVIGGLAGLLIGIGAITIPGIGAVLIGGPLAAALGLTGAAATTVEGAATGAIAGGLIGALMALGLPHEEAKVYEDRIKQGGILLAVPAVEEDVDEVRSILADNNASQIKAVSAEDVREETSVEETQNRYEPTASSRYAYAGVKGGKKTHHHKSRTTRNTRT